MNITWSSVHGHGETLRRLRRLVTAERVPQALLFHGAEGIGKRRVAEAFAASLLCDAPVDGEPCGRCGGCRALLGDTHPDLHRLAPESSGTSVNALKTIRLEQVKSLKVELARVAKLARRRVAIIDDAHLMNDATANSLLKTLEEPTGDVVFLLVTAVRQALPRTIVSRCLQVRFAPLTADELGAFLAARNVSAELRASVVGLAEGSPGRALRILDGQSLTQREEALALLARLPQMTTAEIWQQGERLGALPREACADWLRGLRLLVRDLLVACNGGEMLQTDCAPRLTALLSVYDEATLARLMALVAESERRVLGSNATLRTLVEALLIRATTTTTVRS